MENFIDKNRVVKTQRRASFHDKDDDVVMKHEEFGRVPKYLEDRKQEWQEAKDEMRRFIIFHCAVFSLTQSLSVLYSPYSQTPH
jgi:hypothetical protein